MNTTQKTLLLIGGLLLASSLVTYASTSKASKMRDVNASLKLSYPDYKVHEIEGAYLLINKDKVIIVTVVENIFTGVKFKEVVNVDNVKA